MVAGYEAVLLALPDGHRRDDLGEVKAPVVVDRQIVVKPAPDPVLQRIPGPRAKVLGELACQCLAVRARHQIAERCPQIGWTGGE
jgi:hypothetical protein